MARPHHTVFAIPLLVLFGCTEPTDPVDTIEVSPNRLSLAAGDTVRLDATLRAAGGRELPDRPITWSSNDTTVVTVSANGLVTGVDGGSAIVRAQSHNRVGAAAVRVFGGGPRVQPGDTVVLDQPRVALIAGESAQLRALVVRANGDTVEAVAVWTSTDERVATVSTSGLVTAERGGRALISGNVPGAPPAVVEVGVAPTFGSVSAGGEHACGVTTDGGVYCWGAGAFGRLGTGETSDHGEPAQVLVTGEVFAAVEAGGAHTCALTTNGSARCWGSNADGQLGIGSRDDLGHTLREPVIGDSTFTALSVGIDHSCGVSTAGVTMCWGSGASGKLRDLLRTRRVFPDSVGPPAASVAAGGGHTCVTTPAGTAQCWGANGTRQLGSDAVSGMLVDQVADDDMEGIWGSSPSDVFAVGLQDDRSGSCVAFGAAAAEERAFVVGGTASTCATNIWHFDGTAWTPMAGLPDDLTGVWGTGPSDVYVAAISPAFPYAGAVYHYDGSTWTKVAGATLSLPWLWKVWGSATDDVFVSGSAGTMLHYDGSTWTSQETGVNREIYGIWGTSGSDVWAGSVSGVGQFLGVTGDTLSGGEILHYDGVTWTIAATGVRAVDLWGAASDDIHTVADREFFHFGGGAWRTALSLTSDLGRVPVGFGVDGVAPDTVFAVTNTTGLFYFDGAEWFFVANSPGRGMHDVWAWDGNNVFAVTSSERFAPIGAGGGDGEILHFEPGGPSEVLGGNQFTSLTAGGYHTCGLTPAGVAFCWGDNVAGQAGVGTAATRAPTPTAVAGGHVFAQISAGEFHTCGVTTASEVYCWGENRSGEVGDGTTTLRRAPALVPFDEPMASVSGGTGFSCAVSVRGVAYCWGANAAGQLGDGTTEKRSIPGRVVGPK